MNKLWVQILLISIFTIILLGCNRKEDDFPKVVFFNEDLPSIPMQKLYGTPLMVLDTFYEGQLFAADPYLIVISPKKNGNYHIFDFKHLQYLKSFGTIGKGPGELDVSAQLIRSVGPADSQKINVYDRNSQKIKAFSIGNLLQSKKDIFLIDEIQVPDFILMASNLLLLDSCLMGTCRYCDEADY